MYVQFANCAGIRTPTWGANVTIKNSAKAFVFAIVQPKCSQSANRSAQLTQNVICDGWHVLSQRYTSEWAQRILQHHILVAKYLTFFLLVSIATRRRHLGYECTVQILK